MTIGERIRELRRTKNYSQEYIAAVLGVSRQAVSKWENDTSSPDTKNLIALAELLDSTVEYIALGKKQEIPIITETAKVPKSLKEKKAKKPQKPLKYRILRSVAATVALFIVTCVSVIHFAPVDWDAGSCAGGFKTHIFQKYRNDLVEKFIDDSGMKNQICNVEVNNGSSKVSWRNRRIYIQFEVSYNHETKGEQTEILSFSGDRVWIEKYNWSKGIGRAVCLDKI